MHLTPDQIAKLASLGLDPYGQNPIPAPKNISKSSQNTSKDISYGRNPISAPPTAPSIKAPNLSPTTANIDNQTVSSTQSPRLLTTKISPTPSNKTIIPLLSISGFTILSLTGLILFKSNSLDSASSNPESPRLPVRSPQDAGGPTQVPKSIQHYLLTSQQHFSSALQAQASCQDQPQCEPRNGGASSPQIIEDLNQAILAATSAIKGFPSDYRGYQQRAAIYQALVESKPEFLPQALSDLTQAQTLNPNSPEITRSLASLYALKGDPQNTIYFLAQTVSLEPTKAQNFYDLARLQQQAGLLPQALETYTNLLTIVTDPTQINQVKSEKTALENLLSQVGADPRVRPNPSIRPSLSPSNPTITIDSPTLQADNGTGLPAMVAQLPAGLIIAAPESQKDISVSNLTDSNSLSGTATLPANQKEITLQNSQLASSSQVYLTITQGGKNQTLQVLSKSTSSFTVGLDSPISEDIVFKWWIIN